MNDREDARTTGKNNPSEPLDPIFFNPDHRSDHDFLNNNSDHGFELDGEQWPTAEHCFQAQKFLDLVHRERIRRSLTSAGAKRFGSYSTVARRKDWPRVKRSVMRRIVLKKFTSHADILHALLATGDRPLIENSKLDYYWGCGGNGSGRNELGKILMEIRALLRVEESESF